MITSAQSLVRYERGQAIPDRLTRVTHRHYLEYAQRMLAAYRANIGQTRRELHRAVRNTLASEPDCDRRRIAAFAKLLDDAGEFDTDRKGQAAALRLKIFSIAAQYHPLVTTPDHMFERSEGETKQRIAAELGKPWSEIEAGLYVDVIDHQPLRSFNGYDSPSDLLSAYNLSQLQACLYKSQRITVRASADFAAIVRHAKLARLLVDVCRTGTDQYRIDLSGPASDLHATTRYGIHFARFVAALVACRNWEMRARVLTPWKNTAELCVSSKDGYRSHVQTPAEFDSEVEESLAKRWGESRNGWQLVRDAGILQSSQATFVPDFLLRHDDGREVYLEIVGFWTPEYLAAKRKTISTFTSQKILLAVPQRTAKENAAAIGAIVYKTRIDPGVVVKAAEGHFPPNTD